MADVNLNQALVTGSTAGVVFSAFMLAMRLMFAREKHEYTRLENRIMLLEKAHDDCLKNEAELKSQLGGLKATLALLSPRPIARVSANADGKITEWSNSATNLFGWSRSEAIGSSVNILILHGYSLATSLLSKKRLRVGILISRLFARRQLSTRTELRSQ